MSTTTIFDTLAQHDTQLAQHDQMVTPAAQPNIFDQLAANNGQPPDAKKMPQSPMIGPAPDTSKLDTDLTAPSDPFQKIGYKVAAPFAKKAMDAIDKLREVESFTQEGKQAHPVQAFMGHIANRLEGFLFGNEEHQEDAIGAGKTGMLTNPVTAALLPGAGGEPALAGAVRGGAGLVREGLSALRGGGAAEEGPGLVKQVLKGEKVAQEPAKAAIRTAAGAGEETPLLEGHKTAVDDALKGISEKERAAYKAQDEAAGFDVKETRAKLKDAEWKVKQPEIDEATRERLTKTISESKQSIAEAEKKMSEAGVDAKAADTLFKQRKAGEDFRKALVQHVSADGESVNVDGMLNAAKKLRNTPKGDRLEQFLGKDGADKLMDDLLKAQKIGAHALKVQQIAKWVAGITGAGALGGEAAKLLTH